MLYLFLLFSPSAPCWVLATSFHLLPPRRVVPIYRDLLPLSPYYRLFNTVLSKYLLTQFLHIIFQFRSSSSPSTTVFCFPCSLFQSILTQNYISCPYPTTFMVIHLFILITFINSLHPSSFCHLALLLTKFVMPHDMDTNLASIGTY